MNIPFEQINFKPFGSSMSSLNTFSLDSRVKGTFLVIPLSNTLSDMEGSNVNPSKKAGSHKTKMTSQHVSQHCTKKTINILVRATGIFSTQMLSQEKNKTCDGRLKLWVFQ